MKSGLAQRPRRAARASASDAINSLVQAVSATLPETTAPPPLTSAVCSARLGTVDENESRLATVAVGQIVPAVKRYIVTDGELVQKRDARGFRPNRNFDARQPNLAAVIGP